MTLPNKITLIRIFLLPLFLISVINYSPDKSSLRYVALSIFILISFSDFLDGYFARRLKIATDTGRVLDAAADKLCLISSFVVLSMFSTFPEEVHLPLWVVIIVIGRDIAIILGILFIYLKFRQLYIFPTKLGKISIVCEMATVISILLLFKYSFIVWNVTVVIVIISGVAYLIKVMETFKEGRVSA